MKNIMKPASSSSDEWIQLNVGGTTFNTTLDTMLKGDTMLSRMFSNTIPKKKDEKGCVLINREGKHFDKILNYLRIGVVPPFKDENEAYELLDEADFYCIEELKSNLQSCIVYLFRKNNIKPASSSNDEWIQLNVGGTIFDTTLNTLLKGDTMLSRMFTSTIPKKKDEKGCVFIDRDGKHFHKILKYLKNGVVPQFKDENEAYELLDEADFYCLEELKSNLQSSIVYLFRKNNIKSVSSSKDEWIQLNVGGTIFDTTLNTLLKGDTMLSRMFKSTIPKKKDKNGCVFIDRDGKHFDKILKYLRNGIVPPLEDKNEAYELLDEADFYCLEKLRSNIKSYILYNYSSTSFLITQ